MLSLHVIHHGSVAIHSLSTHQMLNGYLAELPAILDIFPGIANTKTTPIGWWGAMKLLVIAMSTLKIAKWHPLVSFSAPNIHKSAKFMAKLIN